MVWDSPKILSDDEMTQSGHSYRRETMSTWVCRECGANTRWVPGSPGRNYAVLRVGRRNLEESRGDFLSCEQAQAAIVLLG